MKLSNIAIPSSPAVFTKQTNSTNDIILAQEDIVPQCIPECTSAVANKVEKVNTYFSVVEDPSRRGATVIEAPVSQHGVKLYIAIDSDSFQGRSRPGNGGIRLISYPSKDHAVDDAVRLAKGMTRKHDMFCTGFSGAKIVVNSDLQDLTQIDRKQLMEDAAKALKALDGSMYTGKVTTNVHHAEQLVICLHDFTNCCCCCCFC